MNDMKRTSDCCPACCVTPPAPCTADCSLQRTPARTRAAPAPATQPASIGYVNLNEGTFHTLAQLGATERNGDLIARGVIVEVCPVVRGSAPLPPEAALAPELGWISVEDRLPEVEQLVAVYSPPRDTDWPGSVNIGFDCIDPNDDEHASWVCHNAHYEHYCCVVGGMENCTGPSEKAPYTHWHALAPTPAAIQAQGSDAARSLTRCAASRDGECVHAQCPQLKDGEPACSGRHCPLDIDNEE